MRAVAFEHELSGIVFDIALYPCRSPPLYPLPLRLCAVLHDGYFIVAEKVGNHLLIAHVAAGNTFRCRNNDKTKLAGCRVIDMQPSDDTI